MTTRMSSTILVMFMVSLIVGACGGPSAPQAATLVNPTSNTGAPVAQPAVPTPPAVNSGAPVILNILEIANVPVPTDEQDFVSQALNKAIGTDVQLTTISAEDEYYKQLNVSLAAGSPPDLFSNSRAALAQYAARGQLLDLTPYLGQLQPTIAFIGEESLKKGQLDGKTYAIAKAPFLPQFTYWVRKDWLDKLGLQPPTTLDELFNVAVAFTERDPDGNGKKDTYGITGATFTTPPSSQCAFAPIFGAFGVGTPGSIYVKDGKPINSFFEPAMKDALAFILKLTSAGVVDPDLAANTKTQWRDKMIQGHFGIAYAGWPDVTNKQRVEEIKAVNPDAEWIQIAPISGPGGQADGVLDIGATSAMYAIPKTLGNQPEKLQKIFDLLNYVSTGEGSLLVQFGLKGKHFELENGKVVPNPLMSMDVAKGGAGYTWIYQFTGRPEMQYLKTKFGGQQQYIDFSANQPRMQVLNGFVTNPDGYKMVEANDYMNQQLLDFAFGRRSLSEYDMFLEELDTSYDYKALRDTAHKQLTALGYVK
jgi:putative aldouronate transport system substrate-binding protein